MTKWATTEYGDGTVEFRQSIALPHASLRLDDHGVEHALRTLSMELGQYLLCWMRDSGRQSGDIKMRHWKEDGVVWMTVIFTPGGGNEHREVD